MTKFLTSNRGDVHEMAVPDPAGRAGLPAENTSEKGEPGFSPIDTLLFVFMLARKHAALIGLCLAVGAVSAFVFSSLMIPKYLALATLNIERESQNVVDFDDMKRAVSNEREFYQTQYELLRSRALAYRVMGTQNLTSQPQFGTLTESGGLSAFFGDLFGRADDSDSDREKSVMDTLLANTEVAPVRNSSVVTVGFVSSSPALAAQIANAFADEFIQYTFDQRLGSTGAARGYLEQQLAQTKARLEDSEKSLVEYAKKEGIVDVGEKESASEIVLTKLNEELVRAQSDRIVAEQDWKAADGGDGLSLPAAQESRTMEALRAEQVKVRAELEQKLRLYKPAFPEVMEVQGRYDELTRQIATEVSTIKSAIRNRYEAALGREKSVLQKIEQQKGEVMDLRDRSIRYTILQREVDTNRALYDALLQRYKEIGAAASLTISNVSIIDRAEVPTRRSSPSYTLNVGFGLLMGLISASILVLIREQLDDTVKSLDGLEKELVVTPLGLLPELKKGMSVIEALGDLRSSYSEAVRSVRTSLQFSTEGGLPSSLFVTSARPSEGKSSTCYSLAHSFADVGLNVVVVDADLRRPSQHILFGVENSAGLSSYLTSHSDLGAVLRQTAHPRVSFISSGPTPPNPAEILSGSRMKALIKDLESKFDLVMIDGPPAMGLADAPVLASQISATVLVVAANETPKAAIRNALKRLHQAGSHLVGVILNKFDLEHHSYGYGYGYGSDQASADQFSYGPKQVRKDPERKRA